MSALVTITAGQAVTTSLAVAEGTENEHRAVLQLIRTHESSLAEFGRVAFEMRPFETAGGTQQREVANLNEPQATLLLTMMRNSPTVLAFKVRLVKAFYELAQRAQPPDPASLTRVEILRLALDSEEKRAIAEAKVAEQAPTVQAFNRLAHADGAVCITVAAKNLQIRPKELFQWLQAHQWIYRRAGGSGWVAYQHRLQQAVLLHKVTTVSRSDGSVKQVEQVLVTPKGLTVLAKQMQPGTAENTYMPNRPTLEVISGRTP